MKQSEKIRAESELFFAWPTDERKTVTLNSCLLFAEHIAMPTHSALEPLRTLHAAMIAAHQAYCRSPAEEVHIAHAEYKAARFRYNVACGEYVAGLLECDV